MKKNGKLIYPNDASEELFKLFSESIKEGQSVEAFFDAYTDDVNNAQLAKVHVYIRQLAQETGVSFFEMKKIVKDRAGLLWFGKEGVKYERSFADCSKSEMSMVIESLNELGESFNMIFS